MYGAGAQSLRQWMWAEVAQPEKEGQSPEGQSPEEGLGAQSTQCWLSMGMAMGVAVGNNYNPKAQLAQS